jgi:UDP-N-acetylglucosamine:LPS N-acetylglucosamine transferase
MNRLSVIALALREIDPKVRTPFVVEGASHVLLDTFALPYVPLPVSYAMSDRSVWTAWTETERLSLQLQIAQSILKSIGPQAVVFDCLPTPVFSQVVIESGIPIVLCLREMRDLARYLAEVCGLLKYVKLIIVPHPQGAFLLPENLAVRTCFVGQVARPVVRKKHIPDPEQPNIVITGGGGGYPGTVDFYNLALLAVADLRKRASRLKAQLITGPLFRDWHLLRLVENISLLPFEPDMPSRLAESALVICQAGYNTVAELELLGPRTILVPAERQWDDQFARAERVSRGRSNFCVFRGKTATELSSLASDVLSAEIPTVSPVKADGGMKAARLIYEMIR